LLKAAVLRGKLNILRGVAPGAQACNYIFVVGQFRFKDYVDAYNASIQLQNVFLCVRCGFVANFASKRGYTKYTKEEPQRTRRNAKVVTIETLDVYREFRET
jgi:hypothetical protein